MGWFNNKKPNNNLSKKEIAMKRFEEYVKEIMESDPNSSFFFIASQNSFYGTAVMGTPEQLEDILCQLFSRHKDAFKIVKEIIKKFEAGKAKYRKDGQIQKIGDDLKGLAEKQAKEKGGTVSYGDEDTTKELDPNLENLLRKLSEGGSIKLEEKNDNTIDKLKEAHKKYEERLNKKGLSDYNIDDLLK